MTHYSDEELVLVYYGEPDQPADGGEHLRSCPACDARYRELSEVLDGVVLPDAPEVTDRYGVELWQRLAPQLPRRQPWSFAAWVPPRAWMAAAALLVMGFVGGRLWPSAPVPAPDAAPAAVARPVAAADADLLRRRVVLSSVADHLERSDRVLTDLVNAPRNADVSTLQAWASDLVWESRYYRQDALAVEEPTVVAVLDEIERVLLDVVNGPSTLQQADLDALHRRVDTAALLFKVRILQSELRDRGETPSAPASATSHAARIS
jgi:hypothetical protein